MRRRDLKSKSHFYLFFFHMIEGNRPKEDWDLQSIKPNFLEIASGPSRTKLLFNLRDYASQIKEQGCKSRQSLRTTVVSPAIITYPNPPVLDDSVSFK